MRITIRQKGEEIQINTDSPQEQKEVVPTTVLHASGKEIVSIIADIINTETPFVAIAHKHGWKPPAVQHLVNVMREHSIRFPQRFPNNQRPREEEQ